MPSRFLSLSLIALSASSAAHAQQPIVIAGGATCATCTIVSRPAVVIGSTDGPGALAVESPLIALDQRGRFYVFGGGASQGPTVYSPDGRFLRTIGRGGSGPGEFRLLAGIQALPGDSILTLDGGLRRMTVYAPDYTLVRTAPITLGASKPTVVARTAGQVIVNTPDNDRGPALHAVDLFTGQTLRSFASADGTPMAQLQEGTLRNIAADTGAAVWMSYATRYVLERWTPGGSRNVTLTRSVPWFPDTRMPGAFARSEPEPVVLAIDVDARGRIWVLTSTPDGRWKEAIRTVPDKPRPEVVDRMKYRDAVLEVIDPVARRVLISQRYDEPMLTILPGQFLVQAVPDSDDRPTLRIMKLELRER